MRWELADGERPQGALFDERDGRWTEGRGEFRGMAFLHVRAKQIVNELDGDARLPFRFTINAYRGCSHACSYCFARPSHAWLDLDTGRDFERRIVVKVNAVERLRAELAPRRWRGDHIAMGTNTDPYQRCEGRYGLTRGIVEVLSEAANPFSILTKSTLVLRDLELLAQAARRTDVRVNLSIGTLDDDVWRATEPGTPHPRQRLRAVQRLNEAGVPCGVLVAPVLPGLSDRPEQLRAVAAACAQTGAVSVSTVVLHLRPGVKEPFLASLAVSHPHLVERYRSLYTRANAPRADQQRLAAIVGEAVRRAGGLPASSRAARRPSAQPVALRRRQAAADTSSQLGLW